MRSLTLPEFEPMAYGSLWLWSQQQQQQHQGNDHDTDVPMIHTLVCGAARPSDLDQPVVAALAFHFCRKRRRDIYVEFTTIERKGEIRW